jgi:alkanesulfonate monooxygenase SsuD/methylene tetrahydromethanopterin reductase-like flavin-dependent oxidoreductase (luciferase family)
LDPASSPAEAWRELEIGLGLWTMQATKDRPLDHAAPYRDFLEAAALADRLRFHSVWTSEHHFVEDGYCPALLVALAAASATTTHVLSGRVRSH